VEIACINEDALGHYLLQEFAATLKEGDGPVGLLLRLQRALIVRLVLRVLLVASYQTSRVL